MFQDSVPLCSAIFRCSRSEPCFCNSGGTEACALQCLRLHVTFHKPEYTHVATADYSDAAGDRGGRELFVTVQTNGEMSSNKADLLTALSAADPVCLCEFMATVQGGKIRLCFIAQQASPAIMAHSSSPPFSIIMGDISSHPGWICSICSSRPKLVK